MTEDFPYRQEFQRQHSDFVSLPVEPGVISETEAVEAAGLEQMRMLYPAVRVTAWFGDFEAGYPLRSPKRSLLGKRRLIPPRTKVRIWLIKFWNFERWLHGRDGSAVFTEEYVLIDARTRYVIRRFGYQ